jgi:hypothetical protein
MSLGAQNLPTKTSQRCCSKTSLFPKPQTRPQTAGTNPHTSTPSRLTNNSKYTFKIKRIAARERNWPNLLAKSYPMSDLDSLYTSQCLYTEINNVQKHANIRNKTKIFPNSYSVMNFKNQLNSIDSSKNVSRELERVRSSESIIVINQVRLV